MSEWHSLIFWLSAIFRESLSFHVTWTNAYTLCYLLRDSLREHFSLGCADSRGDRKCCSQPAGCVTASMLSPSLLTLLPSICKVLRYGFGWGGFFFRATQMLISSWPGQGAIYGVDSETMLAGKYQILLVPESRNIVQLNHLGVFQARPLSSSSVGWVQKLVNMFLWHILDRLSVQVTRRVPSGDKTCRRPALHWGFPCLKGHNLAENSSF